ncbi:MAG: ABC transporter ATP-binding protein [Proteobacteria bacterium]|nr:ABC transporter ATP-binding protein [Pseudomonadota bacterium]
MSEVLTVRDVRKGYREGQGRIEVLRGASFTLHQGQMAALLGPSGSGKSTLLHVCGLLDEADSGDIAINGQNIGKAGDKARTALRCSKIGFVYQFHYLLPEFSALENVALPQRIAGKGRKESEERAAHLLGQVGLSARLTHRPAELSGGEQQRVAIARALANHPALLIADEPTGNLDQANARLVFDVLLQICQKENTAILMATHNLELARALSRVIEIHDGVVRESRGAS